LSVLDGLHFRRITAKRGAHEMSTDLIEVPAVKATEEPSIASQLAHCIGSENHYCHPLRRHFRFTDGVKLLAELAKAYWLIDVAMSHQCKMTVRIEPFQLWSIRRLPRTARNMAVVECRRDSGCKALCRQYIPYTDFPFDDLGDTYEWYVENQVMMLKSER
jgi:hypothetical protein